MNVAPLGVLIKAAEEQYRLLLEEATELLRNFDVNVPDDFDHVVERRAGILASLQNIDMKIAEILTKPKSLAGQDHRADLEAFSSFREEATRRIIEIDSLVMALARERLDRLQQELGALGRGRTALHGYETSGRERGNKLNSTA